MVKHIKEKKYKFKPDFPTWGVKELESFSDKVGITRTALIRTSIWYALDR